MTYSKKVKTPLRYPGGKSRAVKFMGDYMPNDITEYREPFLGGGSVAVYVSKRFPNANIWVNDLYGSLYNFWSHLQSDGKRLSEESLKLRQQYNTIEKAREIFDKSKEVLASDKSDFEKAVAFFVVNKCSFSGLTESSSFSKLSSKSNWSIDCIKRLEEYSSLMKNWKITNLSYEELLKNPTKETFIYLDPPYEIDSYIYGKKGSMHKWFDHDIFAEKTKQCKCKVMVSYNDSEKIRNRFQGWELVSWDLTYSMNAQSQRYQEEQKTRNELLAMNYKSFDVDDLFE